MRLRRSEPKPAGVLLLEQEHGDAVAWGSTPDGVPVIATLEALIVGELRLPWHLIDKAAWEPPAFEIRHRNRGGLVTLRLELAEVGKLPPVVRERVTRSVVVSRRVALRGDAGAVVAARRDAAGAISWTVTFDPGLDATDPVLQQSAREALAELRQSYGA